MVKTKDVETAGIIVVALIVVILIWKIITDMEKVVASVSNTVKSMTDIPGNISNAVVTQAGLSGQAGRDASGFSYVYNGASYYLGQAEKSVGDTIATITPKPTYPDSPGTGFGGGGGGVR